MEAKIGKISEISTLCDEKSRLCSILYRLYRRFGLGRILYDCGMEKCQGVPVKALLLCLLVIRFCGGSVRSASQCGYWGLLACRGKDSLYRLLNRSGMDWRRLLHACFLAFRKICLNESMHTPTHSSAPACLVFDDTLLAKTGKFIEGVSKVFDHVENRVRLGYKLLGMLYFDGVSSVMVDFSLHRELGKGKRGGLSPKEWRRQYRPKRKVGSADWKRKRELDMGKMNKVFEMLKLARRMRLPFKYVLTDSWFTNSKLLAWVMKLWHGEVHVIGLCKMNSTQYEVGGKLMKLPQIKALKGHCSRHYCRALKSSYITANAKWGGIPVKLFFIHYERQGRWTLLLTTDTKLTFKRAFDIYGIRWNIEVVWKDCKQYLELGSYQGRNLNGQIADCTMAFIAHAMLTLEKRFTEYESMGELYREVEAQVRMLTLWERILPLLYKLMAVTAGRETENGDGSPKKLPAERELLTFFQYADSQHRKSGNEDVDAS